MRSFLNISLVSLTVFSSWFGTAVGQNNVQSSLQRIKFKDKVLPNYVKIFAKAEAARAVIIRLEEVDQGYVCRMSKVYFLDEIIHNPSVFWGVWNDTAILFIPDPAVHQVCDITDKTSFSNLVKYVDPFLAKQARPVRIGNVTQMGPYQSIDGLEWKFEVKNGKEEWFRDNQGFDSREMLEVPIIKN